MTTAPAIDVRSRIAERIHEFDVFALVRLLRHLGYADDEIHFESHWSRVVHGSFVQAIRFHDRPSRRVVVTVNYGLLAYQSPLPTYFLKLLEKGDLEEKSFVDFVRFFDDGLVREYVAGIYPERDERLYHSWVQASLRWLQMLALRSAATLHWVFEALFPELEVGVARTPLGSGLSGDAVTLGESLLGGVAVLGGRSNVRRGGFEVTLVADEEEAYSGDPWGIEATRRLKESALPLLAGSGLSLRVVVVIRAARGWARLGRQNFLGYEALLGKEDAPPRRVVIFNDQVPAAAPSTPGRNQR